MDIIRRINAFIAWDPCDLFGSTEYKWRKYDSPRVEGDLFGVYTTTGSNDPHRILTPIGEWFDDLPILLELLIKLVYYVITWPLCLCVKIPWAVIKGLCIPSKYYSKYY